MTGAATELAADGPTRRGDRRRYQEAFLQREIRRLKSQLRREPGLVGMPLARRSLTACGAVPPDVPTGGTGG